MQRIIRPGDIISRRVKRVDDIKKVLHEEHEIYTGMVDASHSDPLRRLLKVKDYYLNSHHIDENFNE